jgi:hypothetical protein
MNGLPEAPLAGLSDQEIGERLNSGEQSLQNRKLITFKGDDEAVLDDTMVALVGGSVIPDASLLISQMGSDGEVDPHYFSATPELLIEHYSPRAGVHIFEHIPSREALTYRVETLLAPIHPIPAPAEAVSRRLPANVLTRVVELAEKKDVESARQELLKTGMPAEAATLLAGDCAESIRWMGVVAWGLREDEPQGGNSLMTIQGNGRCWLVENANGTGEDVVVSIKSGAACEKSMVSLLKPLQDALTNPE